MNNFFKTLLFLIGFLLGYMSVLMIIDAHSEEILKMDIGTYEIDPAEAAGLTKFSGPIDSAYIIGNQIITIVSGDTIHAYSKPGLKKEKNIISDQKQNSTSESFSKNNWKKKEACKNECKKEFSMLSSEYYYCLGQKLLENDFVIESFWDIIYGYDIADKKDKRKFVDFAKEALEEVKKIPENQLPFGNKHEYYEKEFERIK